MPIDNNPAEELKILEKLKERSSVLRERMDKTFSYFRGDKFTIPEKEGKWESVTSNRAKAEGWKIINVLASAKRKISLAIDDVKEAERKKYALTEMAANGLLYTADRGFDGDPEQPMLNAQMAFYRVVRGWGAYRVLVLDDDDGMPYLDIVVWDRRNTWYIPGRKGFNKVYAERQVTLEQAKEEYKGFNGAADNNGMVTITDIWGFKDEEKESRCTQEAVTIGSEYVKQPTDVKIGDKFIDYLPIRIKAGGAIPLINDSNTDNIAHVGEDYLVNNREYPDLISRLMSYNLTRAGMEAKMPQIIHWDSKQGDYPPEFPKDAYTKGAVILLDKGKGQEAAPPLAMSPGDKINLMLSSVNQDWSMGGLNSISYGNADVSMTAYGTDILNKNTREHIWPFKLAMEQDYIWMATESVRQLKLGGYKESEFTGYNSKFKRFNTKIDPKDIVTDREFQCTLVIDELSDRSAHSQMAIQEVKSGISSLRTALDKHQLADDPDQEIQNIQQEQFDKMLDMPLVKGILAQIEDYADSKKKDAAKAFLLEYIWTKLQMLQMQNQPQPPQITGEEGITSNNPQVQEAKRRMSSRTPQGNIPANIPPQVREAVINSGGGQNG